MIDLGFGFCDNIPGRSRHSVWGDIVCEYQTLIRLVVARIPLSV